MRVINLHYGNICFDVLKLEGVWEDATDNVDISVRGYYRNIAEKERKRNKTW